jgi:hypothetical protein
MEGPVIGTRRHVRFAIAAALIGVMSSGAMVWQASQAAFSGNTSNTGNSWTAGAVSLSDDDSSTAMFSPTGLVPGSTGTKCIKVTYTGNVSAPVKLYGASLTGTLGTYLNLTVDIGAAAGPGAFAGCGGFVVSSTIYSTATLATFAGAKTDYASGVTSWTPSTNGDYRVFRFTYTVVDNNLANGTTCGYGFTWEAQA